MERPEFSPLRGLQSGSLRAVVFDAVGTLMYAWPPVTSVYCGIIGRLSGRTVSETHVRSVLTQRLKARNTDKNLTTDEASERSFWFHLIAELVEDNSKQQECFDALYDHFACPESWRCYEDVDATLASLNRPGLRVAIASNFDARLHRICSGLTELQIVSDRLISSEVGWRKPAGQFFDIVCERMNCRPQEILFVGDDLQNDYHGARAAGLSAALIDRPDGLPWAVGVSGFGPPEDRVVRIRSLTELCGSGRMI